MKKTLLILGATFFGLFRLTHATTATFSGVPTARTVVDSSLVTVATSGLVWVGTFGNETFSFNPALSVAANVAAMTTAGVWHQFGLDTMTNLPNAGATSTIAISPTGKIRNSVTDNNLGTTKAEFFNNLPLYLWIFNASTPATSTEMGIFRAPTGATQPWTFAPNDGGVSDNRTYSTASDTTPTITAIGGAGSTNANQLILAAAVPEPSVIALSGLAGLFMLGIRTRSRND